jgi:thymidylate kinase
MFTVAIIGPDGAGKTTLAKHLEKTFPVPVKYLYMGDNIESSNFVLPTTRWLKKKQLKAKLKNASASSGRNGVHGESRTSRQRGGVKQALKPVKKSLGFINRILDEWYRQLVAFYYQRRGYVVLYDRHFIYDYYHFDIQPQNAAPSFKRRLHGFFLKHGFSEPDLVICLDAPGEVVFKRKGEFSVEFLEKRRHQYLDLKSTVRNFAVVNVDQDLDKVKQEVTSIIWQFHEKRNGRVNHER